MAEWTEAQLLSRAADLFRRAEAGEVVYTPFLTPREQKILSTKYAFLGERMLLLGGYGAAERRRMYFLPEYMSGLHSDVRDELLMDTLSLSLVALCVKGSGYRTLTHRDFLGSVLNLGIERDAIGDICVLSGSEAVLLCDAVMAGFLQANLARVAHDAVKVCEVKLQEDFDGGRKFQALSDTVASPRADAVVAALCNLSRERAQALFARALVEIDYEPTEKYDREVSEGAIVTVRGHGKFIVRSLSDKTKKGRFRLLADRYI